MRIQFQLRRLSSLAWLLISLASVRAAETSAEVPKEVMALVGTYAGSWKSFGIDAQGQVVPKSTWTDSMKATKPVREAQRAWVSTEDVMVFEGRAGAPFNVPGQGRLSPEPGRNIGGVFHRNLRADLSDAEAGRRHLDVCNGRVHTRVVTNGISQGGSGPSCRGQGHHA